MDSLVRTFDMAIELIHKASRLVLFDDTVLFHNMMIKINEEHHLFFHRVTIDLANRVFRKTADLECDFDKMTAVLKGLLI